LLLKRLVIGMALLCPAGAIAADIGAALIAPATHDQGPAGSGPATEQRCALEGWTNNALPGDIEVRSAPHPNAPVIGWLPHTSALDERHSVRFRITASRAGWLRVEEASDRNNTGAERTVSSSPGWVAANSVSFGIQSARGYAAADQASRRLVDLGDDWATDLGTVTRVLACRDDWAQVDIVLKHRRGANGELMDLPAKDQTRYRAWFRGICGNEETTCDMKSVDVGP